MRVTEFTADKADLAFAIVPFKKYRKGYEIKKDPVKGYALYSKGNK